MFLSTDTTSGAGRNMPRGRLSRVRHFFYKQSVLLYYNAIAMKQLTDDDIAKMAGTAFVPDDTATRRRVRSELQPWTRPGTKSWLWPHRARVAPQSSPAPVGFCGNYSHNGCLKVFYRRTYYQPPRLTTAVLM